MRYSGVLHALVSMIFTGIAIYLYKRCLQLGPANTTFYYFACAAPLAFIYWICFREPVPFRLEQLAWPFVIAVFFIAAVLMYNSSIKTLPVSIAATIRSLSFTVTVFLGVAMSKEKLYLKDYAAIVLAVIAIAIFAYPSGEGDAASVD